MAEKSYFETVILTKDESLFELCRLGFKDGLAGAYQAGSLAQLKNILREKTISAVILDASSVRETMGLTIEDSVSKLAPSLSPRIIIAVLEQNAIPAQTVKLLEYGAHDVVMKPLRPRVLVEGIRALIRVFCPPPHKTRNIFASQNNFIVMDYQQRRCYAKDIGDDAVPSKKEIKFTKVEFQVLRLLLAGKGALVSYDDFRRHLWPTVQFSKEITHTLHQLVTNIRKKLSQTPVKIENLRGEGFRLS